MQDGVADISNQMLLILRPPLNMLAETQLQAVQRQLRKCPRKPDSNVIQQLWLLAQCVRCVCGTIAVLFSQDHVAMQNLASSQLPSTLLTSQ